jgi:RNA polymerase sigma-70 factor (ECF subfamily)
MILAALDGAAELAKHWRMAQKKPQGAFEEALVVAFSTREAQIRAIAAKAGPEEMQDVVQDAFLKAVEAGRQSDIAKPVHFLARVARNTVIDRLRTRARHTLLYSKGVQADTADPVASPERALIASERLRRALAVIDQMPPKRKEVFLLHRIDDLSYPQIARRLGISAKTVEKHMALAMLQLAREVDRE